MSKCETENLKVAPYEYILQTDLESSNLTHTVYKPIFILVQLYQHISSVSMYIKKVIYGIEFFLTEHLKAIHRMRATLN